MPNAAADLLGHHLAAGRAEKIAFIDDDGRYTYRETIERVERCANALRALDVRPGDRIVLGLVDSVAFPTAFLGAISAGIVPIPINTLFRASDYAYVLADSDATLAIVSRTLLPAYEEAAAACGWLGRFVVANGRDARFASFDDIVRAAPPGGPVAEAAADDACFWLYSSGSTGQPKGTIHRHASPLTTAHLFARDVVGMTADDVVYSAAKLFFAYGLGNALTFPLAVGATSVLVAERPTPRVVIDTLAETRATIFCGVPTLFSALLDSEAFATRPPLALRLCTSAGESLPKGVGQAWRAATGVDIVDGIGSTEMLHIFVSTRPGSITYGVTGIAVPGYRVRLVDETMADVARGELGEMLVSGPTAFASYWNRPDKTRETILGDWIRTGDKFYENPDGAYVHCGRVDDMIKSAGIWVAPSEVESALVSHAAVLEAAVVGASDPSGLVKPKAFVVLRAGCEPSDALAIELQAFVKDRLAPYKYPRTIVFVESLPKTPTGKIKRHLLREAESHGAPAAQSVART